MNPDKPKTVRGVALHDYYGNGYLVQFPLRLFFHSADVIHGEIHPAVKPAEQLTVEISKKPLLLLLRERKGRTKKNKERKREKRQASMHTD